jgi:hypothetical protein
MNTFSTISIFCFASILLASCDPAKVLVITAHNKSNASVTVYTNRQIIPSADKDDKTKLVIQVPFNGTTSKTFNYGMGNWPLNAISELATNIDSIVIRNTIDRVVFDNKAQIFNYLNKHRSGYAGSVLTIEAK